ncbi:UNVERIFIED_CONTAM: Histone-lysine N-methyltransferase SETMAR [Trichonephila clavipes]
MDERAVIKFLTLEECKPSRKILTDMLLSSVIILHGNKRPHAAKVCVEALVCKKREVLEHPAYSPDLSPCDYFTFEPLKKSLLIQRFYSKDDTKADCGSELVP